jgi:hypothetical protein
MEDRRLAELKVMENKLAAERELRAFEVTLARSEAVKEFLLMGGVDFYTHTLTKVLEAREKRNEKNEKNDGQCRRVLNDAMQEKYFRNI